MEQTNLEVIEKIHPVDLITKVMEILPSVVFESKKVVVNSDIELQLAIINVKEIDTISKSFKKQIEEYKNPIFDLHKKIVAYEKENLAIGDKLKSDQDAEISDYNKRVFEYQQTKNKMMTLAVQAENQLEAFKQKAYEKINHFVSRSLAEYELTQLEKSNVPIAEKIDSIEEMREIIETSKDEIIFPEIIAEPVIMQKKKDAINQVKKYYISDEKEFIAWAIRTLNLDLLDIKIKKSESNKILENIKDKSFIDFEWEYKK